MKNKMKLEFLSKSSNEAFARVAVAAFAAQLDPTVEEIAEIKTAVSEAVTNAIIHGYGGGNGIVYIECTFDDYKFTIVVRDIGMGIENIEQAREPLFTTNPDGERSGMGFTVMETFMDSVDVVSKRGEGTTVIMIKNIGKE